jgi:hypothetical protein
MSTATGRNWAAEKRLGGLWRFGIAITVLNVLGHTVLGFEQAWAHPLVALAAAYGMELGIETLDAWARRHKPRYLGTPRQFMEFLLPAHITGLAVSMLLYAGERFWVVAFATAVAIASKAVLQAPVFTTAARGSPGRWSQRHFMNPSNFGIVVTLLLFPSVGIAPPYQFTENLNVLFHWMLPLLIIVSGSVINTRFTGRIPLIIAWAGGFALQALIRAVWFGTPLFGGLLPMTGLAFVLFSFYMITDPATTPTGRAAQIAFGASTAFVYGILMLLHIVFGLFFSLVIVAATRGMWLYARALHEAAGQRRAHAGLQGAIAEDPRG